MGCCGSKPTGDDLAKDAAVDSGKDRDTHSMRSSRDSERMAAEYLGIPPELSFTCACKSMAGLEPVPGGSTQKINQDRAIALYPFPDAATMAIGVFGVYDGHGKQGEKVSQFVIDHLPDALRTHPDFLTNTGKALTESYITVDDALGEPGCTIDASVSGTTAVTAVVRGNQILLANAGDSRAVVARQTSPGSSTLKAVDLTVDQKPDTPEEMRRLLRCGGVVTPAGRDGSPSRVWHNLRGLAMSRSIGDHDAATVGVIAEPEITEYNIHDDDVCMIIASDGVWELLSSQTVVDIVAGVPNLEPREIVALIMEQASYMWKVEEGDYRDDISCVVLTFPWLDSYTA